MLFFKKILLGSSSSSSSPSRKSSDSEDEVSFHDEPPTVTVAILSEDEMNAIGAKILRAELMGDEVNMFHFFNKYFFKIFYFF